MHSIDFIEIFLRLAGFGCEAMVPRGPNLMGSDHLVVSDEMKAELGRRLSGHEANPAAAFTWGGCKTTGTVEQARINLPIRLLPEVRSEFDRAVDWYDARNSGDGARFAARVGEVFAQIASDPTRNPTIHRPRFVKRFREAYVQLATEPTRSAETPQPIRKVLVPMSDYLILYRSNPTEVAVLSLTVASSRPSAKQLAPDPMLADWS